MRDNLGYPGTWELKDPWILNTQHVDGGLKQEVVLHSQVCHLLPGHRIKDAQVYLSHLASLETMQRPHFKVQSGCPGS